MSTWRGSIWTDKRLWAAAVVAFVFRMIIRGVLEPDLGTEVAAEVIENPALAPTRPQGPATGPMADVERVMMEQQIRRINLDDGSSAEPLMTPEAAAAWFGGLVMFIGGFGAVWLWRRAEQAADEPDRDGQVHEAGR